MASETPLGAKLEGDVKFIKTPEAAPSAFGTGQECGVATTNVSFCRVQAGLDGFVLILEVAGDP